ncbi:pEARLI1-like lipid transfer protein 1, partial [Mucuna pruriens]
MCHDPIPSPKTQSSLGTSGCPRDALKLGVCSGIVNGWDFSIGLPPKEKCCTAIDGFVNFELAICLCTALKANVLGYNLNVPISFTRLINICSRSDSCMNLH